MKEYVIISADYASLEPHLFAHCSGSKTLQEVYHKGEDLYSRIAIDVFKVPNVSAYPDDPNYLGTVSKDFRQQVKVFALAVPYNAGPYQIAASMGYMEDNRYGVLKPNSFKGQQLITKYLNAYPELRKYILKCKLEVTSKGYVQNEFGRIRYLPEAKELHDQYKMDNLMDYAWASSKGLLHERKRLKKALNEACNFKIQSMAAGVTNRAMIELARCYKSSGLDASIRLQVHDEIVVIAEKSIANIAAEKLEYYMCNNEYTKQLLVPLEAKAVIGDNLAETK